MRQLLAKDKTRKTGGGRALKEEAGGGLNMEALLRRLGPARVLALLGEATEIRQIYPEAAPAKG
jgi:hypothetical protein